MPISVVEALFGKSNSFVREQKLFSLLLYVSMIVCYETWKKKKVKAKEIKSCTDMLLYKQHKILWFMGFVLRHAGYFKKNKKNYPDH